MSQSFFVLLPPTIVFMVSLYTKKLTPAFVAGIITAALISTGVKNPISFITLLKDRFLTQLLSIDSFYIYGFLISIGCLIALLLRTGGAYAFSRLFTKKLRSSKQAEGSTFLFSCILFVDDYLSNLTVGHIMRPITDSFYIPRAKLAFLVHSMTSPLAILAPISSWSAMIISQLENTGIQSITQSKSIIFIDPAYVYLYTIPFTFYSLFMIFSVLFIILRAISFGPMRKHEIIAKKEGNLFGGKKPLNSLSQKKPHPSATIFDFILPLSSLFISIFLGTAYFGNYYLLGGNLTFLEAMQSNSNPFSVLFFAGFFSFFISFLYACFTKKIGFNSFLSMTTEGSSLMFGAIKLIFLAGIFGTLLSQDLQTGQYLAKTLINSVPIAFLPCMFYVISLIITVATGSAWGTIGMLLPIAIPMIIKLSGLNCPVDPESIYILYPTLGAIFSGSVCGDHLSPVSETSIMAASSSKCYSIDHIKTQLPYALPATITTFFSFIIAGFIPNYFWSTIISLSFGVTFCIISLRVMHLLDNRKTTK